MCDDDSSQRPPRLLLAAITSGSSMGSLGFTVSLLKFQIAIVSLDIQVDVNFFDSVDRAMNVFATSGHDYACFVSSALAFEPSFILDAISSRDQNLVLGVYPLPGIEWEKVKASGGLNPKLAGTRFNMARTSECVVGGGYSRDGNIADLVSMHAFVCSRRVVDTVMVQHPDIAHADGYLFFADAVYNGVHESPEHRFLRLWGGPAVADMKNVCGNFGSMDFIGSISKRTFIR